MPHKKLRSLLVAIIAAMLGCTTQNPGDEAGVDARVTSDVARDSSSVPCDLNDDPDRDTIPSSLEGVIDSDGDGITNDRDPDSDGDTIPDRVEAEGRVVARDICVRVALDSDNDGIADYLDTDSNQDGIPDSAQAEPSAGQLGGEPPAGGWGTEPFDSDRDGTPDYADSDADNDGIANSVEIAPGGPTSQTDTDADGLPDYRDLDSDGDTILDSQDGSTDRDGDMLPSFRDTDSDNDGLTDSVEAGDMRPETPPVECAREIDAATLVLGTFRPDGVPDFLDTDSDNDGLSDREEMMAGTDRCNADSDGDGQLDSAEVAYCIQIRQTGCATNPAVMIDPRTDFYIVLPNGARADRELEFGTSIRVADVFFIADTTGSTGSILAGIAGSMTTIASRIRAIIPDTWFGAGHYEDFLSHVNTSGTGAYWPFHPLCPGLPGSSTAPGCSSSRYGGIMVTNDTMQLQTAAMAIRGGGGDGYSSDVEALYQLVAGDGLYDRSSPTACAAGPSRTCEIPPTSCAEERFGWACFRSGGLPIVVHYSDTQGHWGARNESPVGTTFNRETVGITPRPHDSDQMMAAYRRVGGRMISLNASTTPCEGRILTAHMGSNPCFDFRVWAEGTGSVSGDGQAYVFDFNSTDPESFITATVNGIRDLATRTPIDVSTRVRSDAMNPGGFDAARFIQRRVPTCNIGSPTNTRCWTEAMGVTHAAAVARTDATTFYRVLPGTRVRFTIYFTNVDVFPGDPERSTLFHAQIDVLGDGSNRLDTRDVFILVPARPSDPG